MLSYEVHTDTGLSTQAKERLLFKTPSATLPFREHSSSSREDSLGVVTSKQRHRGTGLLLSLGGHNVSDLPVRLVLVGTRILDARRFGVKLCGVLVPSFRRGSQHYFGLVAEPLHSSLPCCSVDLVSGTTQQLELTPQCLE